MEDQLSWSVPVCLEETLLPGLVCLAGLAGCLLIGPTVAKAQNPAATNSAREQLQPQTPEEYNKRLAQLNQTVSEQSSDTAHVEYRIGVNDLLEINVFEAPELDRKLRVAATGEISLPLIGAVQAVGLTAHELEISLQARLREYMKDPHAGVFISEVESHPVSVLGAVRKPGVFQVRGAKTVLEMLSMAQGLADDAGNSVLVMRGAGLHASETLDASETQAITLGGPDTAAFAQHTDSPSESSVADQTIRIDLEQLLESDDARLNMPVYPGDIVKVTRAGIVYVVGEVKKPGGFVLKGDERMSVLKAIALAEGLTPTSKKGSARIIRAASNGAEPREIPIDLGKILNGKAPDQTLTAADIVFVPNNTSKAALYKGSEATISALTSLLIFRW